MTRVGIVGCGAIGTALARALARDYAQVARVVALTDLRRASALRLQRVLPHHPPIVSLSELIRRSDLVVEAASGAVSADVARRSLAAHRDVLVMSTGGLLTDRSWQCVAERSRGHLVVPSGALAGLDGVKAMAVGTIRKIRLTSSKPPKALAEAPFVTAKRVRLNRVRRATVLFEGSPGQAVRGFPQNANIAATLMLAAAPQIGRGVRATVRIVADPALRVNRHELEVEGDCGRLRCRVESRPSTENPKTSELAIRSALATLRQRFTPVRIGT